jgi:hypothetical protein
MDDAPKKTTLRMIPYGIYVLTSDDGKGAAILQMKDLGDTVYYGG